MTTRSEPGQPEQFRFTNKVIPGTAEASRWTPAHPDSRVAGAERLADSAEALLRRLVAAIPWEQSGQCPVCGGYREDGEHHGKGCPLAAARAALQASAPSPAAEPTYREIERLDRPGNRANLERAAAEGSEPLDVLQGLDEPLQWINEHYPKAFVEMPAPVYQRILNARRAIAAYASQGSEAERDTADAKALIDAWGEPEIEAKGMSTTQYEVWRQRASEGTE